MKKEIDTVGTKNYYDEYLFVLSNYKKIFYNLKTKIYKLSINSYKLLAVSLFMFLLFLFWYLNDKENINLLIMILFLSLTILSILYVFLIKNRINKLINSFRKSVFGIEKDYVYIEYDNTDYKIFFNEIKGVIIGKYTITFIPNDLSKQFITTRIEYKDEIISIFKKLKKDNLIVK